MAKLRSMGADDLFKLKFLQNACFSPDGQAAAYTVTHVDTKADKEFSTIMMWSRKTGLSRCLTTGKAKDGSPFFSPDGRSIAFMSDRNGKAQIFVLSLDGGDPRQLTELKQGVGGGPVWSPDGSTLAFTAGPDPRDKEPLDLSKQAYRVTRTVYRFDGIGYLDQMVQGIYVISAEGGEPKNLTNTKFNCFDLKWSPVGAALMFLESMDPDSFRPMQPSVKVVDMNGRVASPIGNGFLAQAAEWAPTGKQMVIVGRPDDGAPIGSKNDLWVVDLETGGMENRTPGLSVGVGGTLSMRMPVKGLSPIKILLFDDGRSAYVRVQNGGTVHVYQTDLFGDIAWKPVTNGERVCLPLDNNSGRILCAITDLNTPPELAIVDPETGGDEKITSINDEFLKMIRKPETIPMHFAGPDGAPVEGWYMKPITGSAPYPTILYIHGGPHAAYGNGFAFDFQMLAGQGYGVLFINHRASTGYGDEFSTAIKGNWGVLDYGDLMAGVDEAIHLGMADTDRIGVCGTSGGGNLSCWIVGHTDRFCAAVPQNPVTNWRSFYGTSDIGVWFSVEELGGHPQDIADVYERCSPITDAHCCKTPTLLVQSESDYRCPAEQSEQFYSVLKANGCTVEMLRQPGGFHSASISGAVNLRREHLLAMLDWYNRFVK